MNIILLRHGESVDDILDCYGGAADYPLSDSGIETAKEVSESLINKKIDRIYSSPLRRAIQTANAVNERKKCGITIIQSLKERNSYGVMSGCNKDVCKDIYGYIIRDLKYKVGDYYSGELVIGAEPVDSFDERVKKAMQEIIDDASENGFEDVAVVTHGNVTRSIYKNILNIEGKVDLDLLAKTVVSYENGKFLVTDSEGVTVKKK